MRYRKNRLLLIALTGLLGSASGNTTIAGNVPRTALLELYTSEGCSSCPPTDNWVSSLPQPQFVPQRLVVLAFHVDYWNYLGWPDRFAQRRFTERQQALVHANGLRTAYTPQLVLNGHNFRDIDGIEKQVARINAQAPTVNLTLHASRSGSTLNTGVSVNPVTTSTQEPMELYVALYENNLESQVQAGENSGKRLHHDYVVRALIGPVAVAANKPTHHEWKMLLATDWKTADMGLAAFVQSTRTGEVLQVTTRIFQ